MPQGGVVTCLRQLDSGERGGAEAAPGVAVGGFELAGEGLGFAEGGGEDLLAEVRAESGEPGEVVGNGDGAGDEGVGGRGDEVG